MPLAKRSSGKPFSLEDGFALSITAGEGVIGVTLLEICTPLKLEV
jgi:hypothetical protein